MVDWPDDLVRDIARRRCVIVVGSGVSLQARGAKGEIPPTWNSFLTDCNASAKGGPYPHITKAITDGDLLHACEWLQRAYDTGWTAKLRSAFSTPRYTPTDVHRSICLLDSRIIFSLNFDDILDRAIQDVYAGTCVKKSYNDTDVSEFLRGTERYLVKVHGSLDTPNKIIFTQKQYAQARISAAPFYNAFDSALMTHTFLFMGTGYRDPDINLVLENQNFIYNESHPHFFLTSSGMHEDLKKSLRTNRNLKVIEYDNIDNNHSGFGIALNDLIHEVEAHREILSKTLEW